MKVVKTAEIKDEREGRAVAQIKAKHVKRIKQCIGMKAYIDLDR